LQMDLPAVRHRLIVECQSHIAEERHKNVDPWATVEQRYKVGQVVTGVITKIAPFGAFARIEDGVEGMIQLSEMDPTASLYEGQQLQLRILLIDTERRRLALSMRQVEEPDLIVSPTVTLPAETVSMEIMGEVMPVRLEGNLVDVEEVTSTEVREPGENLTLSQESRECIDRAVTIAKRMHSLDVQPVHLFLGVLQNKRIQDYLAPFLPYPNMLGTHTVTVGYSEDTSMQSGLCPSCKRVIQPHWKHCVYCGKSLAKACPKCGTPRAEVEGVRFCFECGSPLE
jgi:S1 RNA binding family protein/double zinc ribbon protein